VIPSGAETSKNSSVTPSETGTSNNSKHSQVLLDYVDQNTTSRVGFVIPSGAETSKNSSVTPSETGTSNNSKHSQVLLDYVDQNTTSRVGFVIPSDKNGRRL
jgi:co-chaperonin GroES (HSP10)